MSAPSRRRPAVFGIGVVLAGGAIAAASLTAGTGQQAEARTPTAEVAIVAMPPKGFASSLRTQRGDSTPAIAISSAGLPVADTDTASRAQRALGSSDVLVNVVVFLDRPISRKLFRPGSIRLRLSDVGTYEDAPAPGYARRWVIVNDQALMVSAAFGHASPNGSDIARANSLLSRIRVS